MKTTNASDDADHDPRRTGRRLLRDSSSPSENWDDDFEFQAEHARDRGYDAMNAPPQPGHSHEQEESWDDAYEDNDTHASLVKRASKVDDDDVEDWDSSDNELEPHDKHNHEIERTKLRELGIGGFEEEDKTVTARSTSSRPRDPLPALLLPTPPPLPPLPIPLQNHAVLTPSTTSPTLSTFSIPLSSTTRDRASIYSQDPLMPASSGSAPHLSGMRSYPHAAGSTPPRKGRRLRKKSRPPEADIFELEDREPDIDPAPPPVSATHPDTPPPTTPPLAQATLADSPSRASQPSAPPTPSPSLLTRIGSLKRWARRSMGPDDPAISGWRRAKSSTGPSDVKSSHAPSDVIATRGGKSSMGPEDLGLMENLEIHPRAVSPTPAPSSKVKRNRGDSASGQKAGWFFRAGAGAGTEREEVNPTTRTPELSPSKRSGLGLRLRNKERRDDEDERDEEGTTPTPKRTKGKLFPALNAGTSTSGLHTHFQPPTSPTRASKRPSRDGLDPQPHYGSRPMSMLFPRHGSASMGRSGGMPLSVSISVGPTPSRSVGPEQEKEGMLNGDAREKDGGMRGLMNGVRRLSLVGPGHMHKRTKSTGGDSAVVEAIRKDVVGRPRSRTDQHSKTECTTSRVPLTRTEVHQQNGNGHGLLPPVELESPLSAQFARRGSLPWVDYDPSSSPFTMDGSSPGSIHRPLSNSHHQQSQRQSFSASATSLLVGSPARSSRSGSPIRPARSSTTPIPIPVPALPDDAISRTLAVPLAIPSSVPTESRPSGLASLQGVGEQLHPQIPGSPAPQSASLGRSTSSPSHSAGLRRNSLGDLKTPMNTLGEHKVVLPPLGELKIPPRISRAQQGLRRDMGMVREFAGCVEQLKHLQATYTALLGDLRAAYEASPIRPGSRATSPAPAPVQVQFHLPSHPPSQSGTTKKTLTTNSNHSVPSVHQTMSLNSPTKSHPRGGSSRTSQDINRELSRLEHEYGIWWECAELLVELGGGSGVEPGSASNPNLAPNSASTVNTPGEELVKELVIRNLAQPPFPRPPTHVTSMSEPGSIFEQAHPVTTQPKGPPQASPPHPGQWRASTGRHDLSARQLRLLRDMLNTPDPASLAYAAGPYGYGLGYPSPHPHPHPYVALDPQSWAAWNPSAVTLPSEDSSTDVHGVDRGLSKEKKRRASRLGMLGLRDILRGLKRTAVADEKMSEHANGQRGSESSASNSADDDHYNRRRSPWHQHDEHHTAKQSTGPEAVVTAVDPSTRPVIPKSPRRPSLASIFRIGQKGTKNASTNNRSKETNLNGHGNGHGKSANEDERESDAVVVTPGEYSDWERMSRSDLDLTAVGSGMATVRGKKATKAPVSHSSINLSSPHASKVTSPKRTPAASETSLWDSSPPSGSSPQPSRIPLSITEEGSGLHHKRSKPTMPARPTKERTSSWSQAYPHPRPPSQNSKAAISGTVRSAPPADVSSVPDPKLALTPENIKPLLEYAKEVSMRLAECIGEMQILLGPSTSATTS